MKQDRVSLAPVAHVREICTKADEIDMVCPVTYNADVMSEDPEEERR